MNTPSNTNTAGGTLWTLLLCLGVLAAAGAVIAVIFSTEPEAVRETATRQTAMLVSVERAERGTYRPTIRAMGTVVPARAVMISPRVEGEIVHLANAFEPGGTVRAGDPLLKIDPADYRIALRRSRAALQRAEAALRIEQGRQEVARRDYDSLDTDLSEANKALVLREPQLQTALADVETAKATVERAELDLERTTVTAPFDARILTRNVNTGSQITPQTVLGHLVDMDTYWIEASVPLAHVHRLDFSDEASTDDGAKVTIRNETAWPEDVSRTGRLLRLVGTLEDRTRMARVLIAVDDPMQLRGKEETTARLILGAFVTIDLPVRELTGVVRVNRDYLRKNDTLWVMKEGKLDIRDDVEVVFRDRTYAYIRTGVEAGERVVTSRLATVVEGADLRLPEDNAEKSGENDTAEDASS